ncbi:hydrolase TatD [Pseudoalteromonas phenolica]|uniref:Hydrolase TatD n=1 Tax=Pseudoalteromonas phenolica TaxID=161398 RepID=A0A5R9Q8N3_9GAMM|nr:TatD family hydrolase [Pseudoalteromonas phenolica]TLX48986.1 hydrolase TatD [Pseudoalteromonas phenolica]
MHNRFIDAGINLTSSQFDKDRGEMLVRANDASIDNMLLIGCCLQSSHESLSLAKQHDFVSTAGIHPHDAKDAPTDFVAQIRALAEHREVVAIGECGLDFNRDFSPRESQNAVLEQHLLLAQQLDMPVYLHERDAFDNMRAQLERTSVKGVLHCFTGEQDALEFYLDFGLMIGITGWLCDERRGEQLQKLLPLIPDDRLLLETDAPYLLPRSLKPKPKSRRNEPAFLQEIAKVAAELRGQTIEHISEITRNNFQRLFLSDRDK